MHGGVANAEVRRDDGVQCTLYNPLHVFSIISTALGYVERYVRTTISYRWKW